MTPEYTPEQIAQILAKLTAPFEVKDVKWRVVSKSRDGKKGMVAAYADPRVYAERLNEVLGAEGWSCDFSTTTMTGLTRTPNQTTIHTGKITVIASVDIPGISRKSSSGEMWADDDNAMTRAEAQAFKRACSLFGLGKYFYELKESQELKRWVPLDEYHVPTEVPKLPAWALPAAKQAAPQRGTQPTPPANVARPASTVTAALKANQQNGASERIRAQYIRVLGEPLFRNIIATADDLLAKGVIAGDRKGIIEKKLLSVTRSLKAVSATTENMPLAELDDVLKRSGIPSLDKIPDYRALDRLANILGLPVNSPRAA